MSDFLAIAVSDSKVIHLVDWDKPCWFSANSPKGDRLIPSPNSILTDAILFFFQDQVGLSSDPFRAQRGLGTLVDCDRLPDQKSLEEARLEIRGKRHKFLLIAHFGNLDALIREDIIRHKTEILTARIE